MFENSQDDVLVIVNLEIWRNSPYVDVEFPVDRDQYHCDCHAVSAYFFACLLHRLGVKYVLTLVCWFVCLPANKITQKCG